MLFLSPGVYQGHPDVRRGHRRGVEAPAAVGQRTDRHAVEADVPCPGGRALRGRVRRVVQPVLRDEELLMAEEERAQKGSFMQED